MRAELERDRDGCWVAVIEREARTRPAGAASAPVFERCRLPVAMTATREEAEEAFWRLLSKEAGRHGRG